MCGEKTAGAKFAPHPISSLSVCVSLPFHLHSTSIQKYWLVSSMDRLSQHSSSGPWLAFIHLSVFNLVSLFLIVSLIYSWVCTCGEVNVSLLSFPSLSFFLSFLYFSGFVFPRISLYLLSVCFSFQGLSLFIVLLLCFSLCLCLHLGIAVSAYLPVCSLWSDFSLESGGHR